jgi:hypothetical protein
MVEDFSIDVNALKGKGKTGLLLFFIDIEALTG